jgi:hypothetical protein
VRRRHWQTCIAPTNRRAECGTTSNSRPDRDPHK